MHIFPLIQAPCPSGPSSQYIRNQAKIYGRDSERELTKYQRSINDIAAQLALQNPDLLLSKQKLLEEARKKLDESGYDYKKGRSRSKQLSSSESDESTSAPKRVKTTEALRIKRISEIEEDLSDISQRMKFKEKRREQASLSHQYGICDQISEEISALKDRRRVLEKEMQGLRRKEQQSTWYKHKVRNKSASSSSSGSARLITSSESEDPQVLPPSSMSETLPSRSLTFTQADSPQVCGNTPLLDVLSSAIDDANAASPTSPATSTDLTISISPSPQTHAGSSSPSLADIISSAMDSDAFPPSPGVSPLSQGQTSNRSQSLAELLNSAIAGETSVHDESNDPPNDSEHFQLGLPSL